MAGKNRMRPIAMTTLAAILALMPLALGIGQGVGHATAAGHCHHFGTVPPVALGVNRLTRFIGYLRKTNLTIISRYANHLSQAEVIVEMAEIAALVWLWKFFGSGISLGQ